MTLYEFVSCLDCRCLVFDHKGETGSFTLEVTDTLGRFWMNRTVSAESEVGFDTSSTSSAWDAKVTKIHIESIIPVHTDLPNVIIRVTVDGNDIRI